MHAGRSGLSSSKQARHDGVGVAVLGVDNLSMVVCGDATHVVVHSGQHRDWLLDEQHNMGQALVMAVRLGD